MMPLPCFSGLCGFALSGWGDDFTARDAEKRSAAERQPEDVAVGFLNLAEDATYPARG